MAAGNRPVKGRRRRYDRRRGREGDERAMVGQDVFKGRPCTSAVRGGASPSGNSGSARRGNAVKWLSFSVLCGGMSAAALLAGAVAAADRPAPPKLRSRPPALPWSRLVTDAFFDDAFTTLDGPRPDFSNLATPAAAGQKPGQAPADGAGFAWSTLVAGETLVDEIKDRSSGLAAGIATPASFKGGGYRECRTELTAIATMFGVIANYDGDVRWKEEAAAARDLFARAGFNCKAGSDQTYNEAKARSEDMVSMIQGSRLNRAAENEADVLWSDVAGRSPLMVRLEMAEKTLSELTSSSAAFRGDAEVVLHEAEIVAVLTQVLQEPELDDFDDETYRGYAAAMGQAAAALRAAVLEGRYDEATAAVGRLRQSCDTCHGDYR